MSKSVGNVVDPFALAEHYGVDQVRYFSCARCRSARTAATAMRRSSARTNADLANGLGNLAQRSLSMIAKNRR
jgi:methionyl-tRNA synthetase